MIIGAGPAGTSLAAVLARRGWSVLVLEQRRKLSHKVCGEFISWEAQAALQSLGLLAGVQAARPAPLVRAVLTSRSGVSAHFDLPGGSWGLSRHSLDTALADAAQTAGAKLSMGVRVRRFEQVRGGYTVEARANGRAIEIRCRALIAASGRSGSAELPPRPRSASGEPSPRSPTTSPALVGIKRHYGNVRKAPQAGMVGMKRHYGNVRMPPQVELYFFDGGYAGLAPIEDGRVNLCILAGKAALEGADKDPDKLIEALTDRLPGIARRLAGAEPLDGAPLAAAPIDLWRRADPWPSVACVGDAAAMIPPLAGDGIAAALRSVELCAPLAHATLSGDMSLEQWERAYRRRWHASFDAPLALARKLETWLGIGMISDLLLGMGSLLPLAARKIAALTRSRAST